jgi:hypothetical protein
MGLTEGAVEEAESGVVCAISANAQLQDFILGSTCHHGQRLETRSSLSLFLLSLAVSLLSFNRTPNPLLINLTEHVNPFNSTAMLSAFEAGAHEDQEEAEGALELVSLSLASRADSPSFTAILAELDAISKELQLWAPARSIKTTDNERGGLTRTRAALGKGSKWLSPFHLIHAPLLHLLWNLELVSITCRWSSLS